MIKAFDDYIFAFWAMVWVSSLLWFPLLVGVIVLIVERLRKWMQSLLR